MKLRILRKTIKTYDRANDADRLQHYDTLQYCMKVYDMNTRTESFEWRDVPVVIDEPTRD